MHGEAGQVSSDVPKCAEPVPHRRPQTCGARATEIKALGDTLAWGIAGTTAAGIRCSNSMFWSHSASSKLDSLRLAYALTDGTSEFLQSL